MQLLIKVDGSILAGVFITFSFCVVPYCSNAAISNIVVVCSSNCSIAASSTKSMVALFTKRRQLWKLVVVQLFMWPTIGFAKTLCRLYAHRAHIHVVLSRKTSLQQQCYSEYLSV